MNSDDKLSALESVILTLERIAAELIKTPSEIDTSMLTNPKPTKI